MNVGLQPLKVLAAIALAGAVAVIFTPRAAAATPYDDLVKVETAFQNAKSWHAVEQFSNGRTTIVDYAAPDRWRMMNSPTSGEIIVGNDVYMVSNGKSSRMPFGGGLFRRIISHFSQFANENELRQTAQDLGMQTLNGQPVHVYSFKSHGALATLYVGPDSLPLENKVQNGKHTTIITYSEYNQPITIQP